jgi:hypothetical protein
VGLANNEGIWSDGSGDLELIARTGSAAPAAPAGAVFDDFSSSTVSLNAAGDAAFAAVAIGGDRPLDGTFYPRGVWAADGGEFQMFGRGGDPAPGTLDDVYFEGITSGDRATYGILFNDAGHTAFRTGLSGAGIDPENDEGIWRHDAGGLSLVAREEDPVAGAPPEVKFSGIGLPVMNAAGRLAFYATIAGPGVTDASDNVIWTDSRGMAELAVREGQHAPGTPTGVAFAGLAQTSINASGQLAFPATLRGPAGAGVLSTNDTGVWAGNATAQRMVVREDDPAPGFVGDVKFSDLFVRPVINAEGETAFRTFLRGASVTLFNDESLWSEGAGALTPVAREGDRAPGTPDGVVFGRGTVGGFDAFDEVVLNATGQMAFLGFVTGPDVFGSNDRGIWAQDRNGVLHLIAREGDALTIAPGVERTIDRLEFLAGSGNGDGRGSGFNDAGLVAFRARFDVGEGIFVSYLVAASPLGDFDSDGLVEGDDFLRWQRGESPGMLSAHDLALWRDAYTATPAAMGGKSHVPEPATILLATFAVTAIRRRRLRTSNSRSTICVG